MLIHSPCHPEPPWGAALQHHLPHLELRLLDYGLVFFLLTIIFCQRLIYLKRCTCLNIFLKTKLVTNYLILGPRDV